MSAMQKANVIVRVISTLLLVCISAYFLHNQIQKSTAVSYLYSDEAATLTPAVQLRHRLFRARSTVRSTTEALLPTI